jgi:integrase/recombinase XerD
LFTKQSNSVYSHKYHTLGLAHPAQANIALTAFKASRGHATTKNKEKHEYMTFWQYLTTTFTHNSTDKTEVAQDKQRVNNKTPTNSTFEGAKMSQARVLTERELRKVLAYCSSQPHAERNRAMLLCTHLAGMRVGEVSALRICDVLAADGTVKDEIHLSASQTKGNKGRTVYVAQRLRDELTKYMHARFGIRNLLAVTYTDTQLALFPTQKSPARGFTPNTLCQLMHLIYKRAGIEGASSHSGRRSFITKLADKGVGVHVLMHLASHKSIATTQRYITVNDDMKRKAVELV